MKNVWKIGDKCFYEGKPYEIVAYQTDRKVVIWNSSLDDSHALVVEAKKLEPRAQDVFNIGDKVQTVYSFRGAVVGFEPETNRVICISDKTDQYHKEECTEKRYYGGQRVRWSYAVSDLQKVKEAVVTFEYGHKYGLQSWDVQGNKFPVRVVAMPDYDQANMVVLYAEESTQPLARVPRRCSQERLQAYRLEYCSSL